ncbi:MAG: ABC transporter ATP-binding protein [Thermoleophilia bacterium]|nr:ABC transporter ATP-binding protein [Thermoleophilia bacterium]
MGGRSREDTAGLVAVAPALRVREIFRRFWPDARPYRRWIGVGLLIALLVPLVEAAEIWMFKLVVDDVLVPRDLEPLAMIALATVGIVATGGVLSFADEYLAAWVGERFVLDLRTRVYGHLQRATPESLEDRRAGDTLTRVTHDVDSVEGIVLSGVAAALSAVTRIVVFAGILVYLDWVLAVVALVAAPFLWFLAERFSRRIRRASREARRRSGGLSAVGEESLGSAALVQAYNREDAEVARFRREGEGIMSAELAAARVRALFTPVVDLIELGAALLVIGMGTWAVTEGRITVGGLLAFLTYVTQLYSPVRELGGLVTSVYSASAAAERVIEVLDMDPAVTERPDALHLGRARGGVVIDGVTFAYPGTDRRILDGASLEVAPGETVALVGGNGQGKSTIAKLLVRFHDPGSGAVRIDGVDVRDVTLEALRENVTVLLQEALIMHGSVRDNLLLGRPGATDSELMDAARETGADAFIAALPDGLDTVVGQRGRRLSGGQRQLLAITRALLRDAPILVLDEPTTGLDRSVREHLREPVRRLARERTAILITHDPVAMGWADRVVALTDGRLVEQAPVAGI